MVFDVEITDLYGTVLATVTQYTDLSVTMGISDDRTASLTLSVYNPAVQHLSFDGAVSGKKVAALGRMVRIKYRTTTIFWGLVTAPKYSTEKANVVVDCQGPAFKLRHRQLNNGDDVVGTEEDPVHSPSDHTTMQAIVEAAYDTPGQYAENIPDIGITVENVSGVSAPPAFWTDVQRGSNNWDKLIEVGESAYGGEFDIVPYDPTEAELPFDTTMVEVP